MKAFYDPNKEGLNLIVISVWINIEKCSYFFAKFICGILYEYYNLEQVSETELIKKWAQNVNKFQTFIACLFEL